MKICGIYCIENNLNHQKYVGLSNDCYRRWMEHKNKASSSIQRDDIKKPLYNAIRKHGINNFSFYILEECSYSVIKEKEIFWIEKLNTYYSGYNATKGGDLPEGHILRGEEHGMSVLLEKDVVFCRECYARGEKSSDIWKEFFQETISYQGFQRMWHGKTWKHVLPETFDKKQREKQKLTVQDIKIIKQHFTEGKTCAEVFHIFQDLCSRTTINDIYHKRRYAEIS